MASVTLEKINKVFGNIHIIKDVDLEVDQGEFVVFVGPSGCGKSTLLRLIAGLESITGGELRIANDVVNDLPPRERGVGMVFQSYALYPHMSVYENMAFGLKLAKTAKETVEERVMATARILQLEELLHRKPRELSGGQRQRVAMGRAMSREPRILLFDEPLSNLDAALRVQMRNEIARLHQRLRSTIVYVTHDQIEAMTLGDRIVVLNDGNVQQVGSPLELYQQPRNLFVATFIGSPKMNLLEGSIERADADGARVWLDVGTTINTRVDAAALGPGDRVTVGVRPEHLDEDASHTECLDGQVSIVEHLGEANLLYLTLADGSELVVRGDGSRPASVGAAMTVSAAPGAFHVFDARGNALSRLKPGNLVTAGKLDAQPHSA
ncbi:ABC transporter ATP-binding protein [Arhodomonas sp. AD133]|uniref:ABC transporter ATP-binding protein n=1 Tax=Arhodomonas sp. AD133 TaxID=3415009 RepID=UPI003EB6CB41